VDFNIHTPSISKDSATFFLYNLSGQIVGYQRYMPLNFKKKRNDEMGRYYTYRSNNIGIFGLETYTLDCPCVFLTEGIFDAVRLTRRGCCALALLCNNPDSSLYNFLHCLGKPLVSICDKDIGGRSLRKVGHYFEESPEKDLGVSDESFVDYLIKTYYN